MNISELFFFKRHDRSNAVTPSFSIEMRDSFNSPRPSQKFKQNQFQRNNINSNRQDSRSPSPVLNFK